MKLNLGCSDDHRTGYVNVDRAAPADVLCDLDGAAWPWPDSSADEIFAHDVFEHLHSQLPISPGCSYAAFSVLPQAHSPSL